MKGKFGGFKGAGKASSSIAKSPEVLEFQFQEKANELFESLMDWNSTPQQLTSGWQQVIALRTECMKAYLTQTAAAPAASGKQAAGAAAGDVNWKGALTSEIAKQKNSQKQGAVSKDDITYETSDGVGSKGTPEFVSVVSSSFLKNQYEGEPAPSKKVAEHNAARAAMEHESPEAYHKARGVAAPAAAPAPPAPQQGKKRKAAVMEAEPKIEAKQSLSGALNLLLAGPPEKGAIVYETAQAENGSYVSTVTLQAYDPSVGYQGVPAASKKLAENAAAEAALEALKATIAPLEEEAKARKNAKNKESLQKFKEARAQKTGEASDKATVKAEM